MNRISPISQTPGSGSGMLFENEFQMRMTTCWSTMERPSEAMKPLFGRVSVNWNRPRSSRKSDKPDDGDGDDQRRNVAKAVADQGPDAHRAQHEEFAMGEIDDAGQSEDQCDPDPHQDDHARDRETVHELLDEGHHDVVSRCPRRESHSTNSSRIEPPDEPAFPFLRDGRGNQPLPLQLVRAIEYARSKS